MNNYKKLNNIFGFIAFAISLVVYSITMEKTASFWDCGEFISASYKLQVVHPPGAPFFLLVGRFFSLFAGGNLELVPVMINFVSALSSALCVMFTFWITTYFGRRLMQNLYKTTDLNGGQVLAVMLSGLVAALTLTFSDTFWFSAVEAEVYAASSFFTAITFWAILKWEERADEPHSDRWLIFIGYLVGLAIGVHLLNLLVIPAIAFVYYFRKYKPSRKGIIWALIVGGLVLVLVQLVIIPGIPSMAAFFDRIFVNDFGMGFNSGVIFFAIFFIAVLTWGIWFSIKKQKVLLNTALLGFTFIIIGFSSYAMVVIRSNAHTPINMNTPSDPFSLVYYLNREQYGERPLFKGPYYDAKRVSEEKGAPQYIKGKDKYEINSYKDKIEYEESRTTFFPRIYDGNDQQHVQGYKLWADIKENEKPKFKHNWRFFMRYQMGWMYWRYFMWNFAGRQNDEQGMIGPVNGNWISGISAIDNMNVGPQSKLPDHFAANKGRNKYFLIPFVLGLLGLIWHISKARQDSAILGILFLITGVVLILYLNPPPYEPRERDYVFVGSFQVFCTWVGFGVLFLFDYLRKKLADRQAAIVAGVIALSAPFLMASQNWDDHNRNGRYMTIDFAKDYLTSCPPNAILFTNGDNDTYPLWYAQNVENIRTDVRVINLSLLQAGDYASTMLDKVYESAGIKSDFTKERVENRELDVVFYQPDKSLNQEMSYELSNILKYIASTDQRTFVEGRDGMRYKTLPVNKFRVTIDPQKAIASGWVKAKDSASIIPYIEFSLGSSYLIRSRLMLYDAVANNMYTRPICFTSTTGSETFGGLQNYLQLNGLVYQLVPINTPPRQSAVIRETEYGRIDAEVLYQKLVKEYKWGGMEKPGYYVDDKAQLVPYHIRVQFGRLAREFMAQGNKEKAVEVLDYVQKVIPSENVPLSWSMLEYIPTYYDAGAKEKGAKLLDGLFNQAYQIKSYYAQFKGKMGSAVAYERNIGDQVMDQCIQFAKIYDPGKEKALEQKRNAQ